MRKSKLLKKSKFETANGWLLDSGKFTILNITPTKIQRSKINSGCILETTYVWFLVFYMVQDTKAWFLVNRIQSWSLRLLYTYM